MSPQLLEEMRRTFARPKLARAITWTSSVVVEFLVRLEQTHVWATPPEQVEVVNSDPSDNRLIEAALEGKGEYLVSGDAAVLALGSFQGVEIISPARFVAVLATLSDR
jgi:putative PIN family toxin of toxin-antitoxin system